VAPLAVEICCYRAGANFLKLSEIGVCTHARYVEENVTLVGP